MKKLLLILLLSSTTLELPLLSSTNNKNSRKNKKRRKTTSKNKKTTRTSGLTKNTPTSINLGTQAQLPATNTTPLTENIDYIIKINKELIGKIREIDTEGFNKKQENQFTEKAYKNFNALYINPFIEKFTIDEKQYKDLTLYLYNKKLNEALSLYEQLIKASTNLLNELKKDIKKTQDEFFTDKKKITSDEKNNLVQNQKEVDHTKIALSLFKKIGNLLNKYSEIISTKLKTISKAEKKEKHLENQKKHTKTIEDMERSKITHDIDNIEESKKSVNDNIEESKKSVNKEAPDIYSKKDTKKLTDEEKKVLTEKLIEQGIELTNKLEQKEKKAQKTKEIKETDLLLNEDVLKSNTNNHKGYTLYSSPEEAKNNLKKVNTKMT